MRHFLKPHQYYSILSQHNTNTTMTFQYYLNTTSTLHKRFQYYSILQKRPVNTTSILHCTFWTSILLNTTNTTEVQYYKIINTTQYYQYYQYVWGQLADVGRWGICFPQVPYDIVWNQHTPHSGEADRSSISIGIIVPFSRFYGHRLPALSFWQLRCFMSVPQLPLLNFHQKSSTICVWISECMQRL